MRRMSDEEESAAQRAAGEAFLAAQRSANRADKRQMLSEFEPPPLRVTNPSDNQSRARASAGWRSSVSYHGQSGGYAGTFKHSSRVIYRRVGVLSEPELEGRPPFRIATRRQCEGVFHPVIKPSLSCHQVSAAKASTFIIDCLTVFEPPMRRVYFHRRGYVGGGDGGGGRGGGGAGAAVAAQ